MSSSRNRAITIAGSLVAVTSLAIMTWKLAPDWAEVLDIAQRIKASTVIVLLVSILVAEGIFALLWTLNMRHLGAGVSWTSGIGAYFYAGLSRFLPGAVFPYVARTAVVVSRNTSGVQASVAAGFETVLSSVVALSWAAAGLSGGLVAFDSLNRATILMVAVIISGLGVVTHLILPRALDAAKLRVPEERLRPSAVATSFIGYAIGWFTMGLGMSSLLADVASTPVSPIDATGALALAWFAGFIAVPVPGGLGVREAVIAGVLSSTIGVENGVLVAFSHRVAWTAVISITGLIALASRTAWGNHGSAKKQAEAR